MTPATGSGKGPTLIKDLGQEVTIIESKEDYMSYLSDLTSNLLELKKAGYVIKQLSLDDLNAKSRCQRCDARCGTKHTVAVSTTAAENLQNTLPSTGVFDKAVGGSGRGRPAPRNKERGRKSTTSSSDDINKGSNKSSSKAAQKKIVDGIKDGQQKPEENTKFRCRWHSGVVQSKAWTCCGEHVSQPGCKQENEHLPREVSHAEMIARFQCYDTPEVHERPENIRTAVAIDCEMGTAFDNQVQLIRVTLIDYFTAEVLLDSLVWPDVAMAHLNTQYSGVTWQQLKQAQRENNCIMGTDAARSEVLKYVGPTTIVVAHGGSSDLGALNWIHPVVIDSLLIETAFQKAQREQEEADREAEEAERQWLEGGPGPSTDAETAEKDEKEEKKQQSSQRGKLSLKGLAQERLNRKIQMGRRGHDSLEDALATRDIVHWHVQRLMKEAQDEAAGLY
ncbi:hypothetical protein ACHAQA_006288 [Verticillium albo-atrum]